LSSNRLLKYLIQWFVLVALQVLLFKDFAFFNTSYCFAYVGAFLLLPFEVSVVVGMVLAFATGFVIDVFYDTLGMHTAASVLVAYLRGPLQKALTPAGNYEDYMEPTLPSMGLQWYAFYLAPLVLVHACTLLSIEYLNASMIPLAMLKGLATVPFTVVMIALVQNVLVPR
jgi:hypothetical protein